MEKADLVKLIPFYVAGTLDIDEKLELQKALQTDNELKKELEFWNNFNIAAKLRFRYAKEAHPIVEDIASFANGELENNPIKQHAIKKHLEECSECTEEVNVLSKQPTISNGFVEMVEKIKQFFIIQIPDISPTYTGGGRGRSLHINRLRLVYVASSFVIVGFLSVFVIKSLIVKQPYHLKYTVTYQEEIARGQAPLEAGRSIGSPKLELTDNITDIDFHIPVLHNPFARYIGIIISPTNDSTQLSAPITTYASFERYDSLQTTLSVKYFTGVLGSYKLVLHDISGSNPDLKEYHYRFEVVMKK